MRNERAWWKVQSERVGEEEKEIEEKCAGAIDLIRMFPLSCLSVFLQTQIYGNT